MYVLELIEKLVMLLRHHMAQVCYEYGTWKGVLLNLSQLANPLTTVINR